MSNIPLVSILMSIYNVDEYLEESLDSILNQSYQNLEIICVDNGSTDNCLNILKAYQDIDKRIKVISLQHNIMLCGGRNVGLENASGEYVCFIDPDDWVEKDYIKEMVETITTKKDTLGQPYNLVVNYDAINYCLQPDGSVKKIFVFFEKSGEKTLSYINKNPTVETNIPMWGRLYRKSFLDKYPEIKFLEGMNTDNVPYTFKLLAHMKRFYVISSRKNATYWRRMITPEGAITVVVLWKNLEIPKCLDNLYEYLVKNNLQNELKVPFALFFNVCFPRHTDMPSYYLCYKRLLQKMEKVVKSSNLYTPEERGLCDLLLYTTSFFDFSDRYFSYPEPHIGNQTRKYKVIKYKLFGFIPLLYIKNFSYKRYINIFKLPFFKVLKKGNRDIIYLFHFIPLFVKKYRS